jgi:hypothetical protein
MVELMAACPHGTFAADSSPSITAFKAGRLGHFTSEIVEVVVAVVEVPEPPVVTVRVVVSLSEEDPAMSWGSSFSPQGIKAHRMPNCQTSKTRTGLLPNPTGWNSGTCFRYPPPTVVIHEIIDIYNNVT